MHGKLCYVPSISTGASSGFGHANVSIAALTTLKQSAPTKSFNSLFMLPSDLNTSLDDLVSVTYSNLIVHLVVRGTIESVSAHLSGCGHYLN